MRKSRQRLIVVGVAGGFLALAAGLVLYGMRDAVSYFYAPSELAAKAAPGTRVRIGGLVAGKAYRSDGTIDFAVTDGKATLPVHYDPMRGNGDPDLFKDKAGIVAEGVWTGAGKAFVADRVLAKHDERYMPPEAVEAMKRAGTWKGTP